MTYRVHRVDDSAAQPFVLKMLKAWTAGKVVAGVLGHSTTRVTERYAAVVPELAEEAAVAMDRALQGQVAQ